jgi:hypothetical protein
MQELSDVHHSPVRNGVGPEGIHASPAESEGNVSDTYSILMYSAHELPKEYRNLIYSKWQRSLRYGSRFFNMIDSKAYYAASEKIVSNILHRIDAVVRMAVLSDDHDVVLGFSVARGSVLDYIYVHVDQRRMGIGTNLLPKGIDTISHLTNTGLAIWKTKYRGWKFDPFN